MRVLIVEDEPKLADVLLRACARAGWATDHAATGTDALWHAQEFCYDAVVLDVGIPEPDGFEVCRTLRAEQVWVPVLMLTARDAIADRVCGLDAGADDYLVKPFSVEELAARLRALSRRTLGERPAVLVAGDLELDPATRSASRAGTPVDLSAKEFAVLEILMRRKGEVVSRTDLLDHAWSNSFDGLSNVADVYIRYLREKVDRPFGRRSIETVRGAGYRLDPDGGAAA